MKSSDPTSSGAVLLADDSPTIRKIVELSLADSGLGVEAVANGHEALATLAGRRFSAVLVDVAMPGPSGYELCRRIKRSATPVPTLLLVGTFEPFDAERARRCGADGWLVKPFETEVLRARIDALLTLEVPAAADPDEPEEPEEIAVRPVPAPVPPADRPTAGEVSRERPTPSAELVEAVARAVVGRLSERVVREIVREVVPDLAAAIIRERLDELERE